MQLGMTFGTPMAVPEYGVYTEHLRDAGCAFYPARDAAGLARAIERIADGERETLVRRNRDTARDWGWTGIVRLILSDLQGRTLVAAATAGALSLH